jgi:phosphate uptake regulator
MDAHVVPFPETFDNTLRLINREIEQVNDRVVRIVERAHLDSNIYCPQAGEICRYDCEGGCHLDRPK